MREILFKAKCIEGGNWVFGNLILRENGATIGVVDSDGLHELYVDPDTICQYTGLTDKNGNRVFEGDIVKHYNKIGVGEPDKYIIVAIRWEECKVRFIQDTEDGIYAVYDSSVFEVIGNIFDNPELLENK